MRERRERRSLGVELGRVESRDEKENIIKKYSLVRVLTVFYLFLCILSLLTEGVTLRVHTPEHLSLLSTGICISHSYHELTAASPPLVVQKCIDHHHVSLLFSDTPFRSITTVGNPGNIIDDDPTHNNLGDVSI